MRILLAATQRLIITVLMIVYLIPILMLVFVLAVFAYFTGAELIEVIGVK